MYTVPLDTCISDIGLYMLHFLFATDEDCVSCVYQLTHFQRLVHKLLICIYIVHVVPKCITVQLRDVLTFAIVYTSKLCLILFTRKEILGVLVFSLGCPSYMEVLVILSSLPHYTNMCVVRMCATSLHR